MVVPGIASVPVDLKSHCHGLPSARSRLEEWLKQNGFENGKRSQFPKATTSHTLTVSSVVQRIARVYKLLDSLETSVEHLRPQMLRLSEGQWSEKAGHVIDMQRQITDLINEFAHPDTVASVKFKLRRRRKKQRQRHQRLCAREEQRDAALTQISRKDAAIDRWLQKNAERREQEKQEKIAREEQRRKLILLRKTKSTIDERRMLIKSLKQLRQLRKERKKGESSIQDDLRFEEEQSHLSDMIDEISAQFDSEMIAANTKSSPESHEGRKAAFKKALEMVLFERHQDSKDKDSTYPEVSSIYQLPQSADDIAAIRNQWDEYIVKPGDVETGSYIPSGFVVPKRSLDDWMKAHERS